MPYEINYEPIDIPEVDAFLNDYRALCKKHGMQFTKEDYESGGSSYIALGTFTDNCEFDDPNINYSDRKIPCIAAAWARIKKNQP